MWWARTTLLHCGWISPSSNSPSWGSVVGGGTSQWSGESVEHSLNGLRTELQGFWEAKNNKKELIRAWEIWSVQNERLRLPWGWETANPLPNPAYPFIQCWMPISLLPPGFLWAFSRLMSYGTLWRAHTAILPVSSFSQVCPICYFPSMACMIEVSLVYINIDTYRPHHGRARPSHRPGGHYRKSELVKWNNCDS